MNRSSDPLRFLLLVGIVATLSGCASSGAFLSGNATQVELSEANYEIVATNVQGSATAGYLFGASAGFGPATSTIALARISGEGQLYQAALSNLWANVRSEYGTVTGEALALVNVRYDIDVLNLFVYTQPTLTVRADVVEFTK